RHTRSKRDWSSDVCSSDLFSRTFRRIFSIVYRGFISYLRTSSSSDSSSPRLGVKSMLAAIVEFDFLRYTFLTGILIGIVAPLLGTFLVVRRLSLLPDALSHVTLAVIAFGLFMEKQFVAITLSPVYSGMGFSVIGAVLIEKLRAVYTGYQELGIPIILSGGVGLSVIFISLANGFNTDLFNYLFGSVSAVSQSDFLMILGISIFIIIMIILFYK